MQHLELVEHQQQRRVLDRQLREQAGKQAVEVLLALLGAGQALRTTAIEAGMQGIEQVAAELARVVVLVIQVDPGHRAGEGRRPLAGQHRLAETAGRLQHGQAGLGQALQPLVETRPGEQTGMQGRRTELGRNQRQWLS
ncbi:hypothetical protein D3C85_1507930 [compost metagenome]